MFSQGFKSASSYLGHSAFLYYYEYKKIFVMGFLFLGFRKYEYETNDFPLKHNLFIFHLKGEVYKALVLSTLLTGVRFGAYEKTYSTDSVASVMFVACVVSAFAMPFIIILVQPLFFKGLMPWSLIATITIGFFVGLATSLGCL